MKKLLILMFTALTLTSCESFSKGIYWGTGLPGDHNPSTKPDTETIHYPHIRHYNYYSGYYHYHKY